MRSFQWAKQRNLKVYTFIPMLTVFILTVLLPPIYSIFIGHKITIDGCNIPLHHPIEIELGIEVDTVVENVKDENATIVISPTSELIGVPCKIFDHYARILKMENKRTIVECNKGYSITIKTPANEYILRNNELIGTKNGVCGLRIGKLEGNKWLLGQPFIQKFC